MNVFRYQATGGSTAGGSTGYISSTRLLHLIISVTFLAILLTACGDGDAGDEPAPDPDPPPPPGTNANLAGLAVSASSLEQVFQVDSLAYTVTVGFLARSIRIHAPLEDAAASATVSGVDLGSDGYSQLIELNEGVNPVIDIIVTAEDGVTIKNYKLTVTRGIAADFAQQAYAKASNSGFEDQFGLSVAVSEDGNTLAVGAPFEKSSATGIGGDQTDDSVPSSGAVYVFTRSGAAWSQQAYIKGSFAEINDQFGASVALSENTLAVGAPLEDSSATGANGDASNNSAAESGAVFVFIRSGTLWSQQAYLKASNSESGDQFGGAIALSGDTLAVAAVQEDSEATGVNGSQISNSAGASGAVYIFTRNTDAWSQQAYVKASNTEGGDLFGASVSLSVDTLAVGASNEDSGATGVGGSDTDNSRGNSGAVYIFTRSSSSWSQQAYIKASNTGGNDEFGSAVSVFGDSLAVGVPLEDSSATGIGGNGADDSVADSGAAYVFTRSSGVWTQEAYIKASNTQFDDGFGVSISLSGDSLAVGANLEDSNAIGLNGDETNNGELQSGALYLFTRTGGTWTQLAYVKASNTEFEDRFGASVALSGDTLAAGANLEDSAAKVIDGDEADNNALSSGAVYIWH